MTWRSFLLAGLGAACLLAWTAACGGSSTNPYARNESIHRDSFPPDYNPGYNPRGPGRHSKGFAEYGRPEE